MQVGNISNQSITRNNNQVGLKKNNQPAFGMRFKIEEPVVDKFLTKLAQAVPNVTIEGSGSMARLNREYVSKGLKEEAIDFVRRLCRDMIEHNSKAENHWIYNDPKFIKEIDILYNVRQARSAKSISGISLLENPEKCGKFIDQFDTGSPTYRLTTLDGEKFHFKSKNISDNENLASGMQTELIEKKNANPKAKKEDLKYLIGKTSESAKKHSPFGT